MVSGIRNANYPFSNLYAASAVSAQGRRIANLIEINLERLLERVPEGRPAVDALLDLIANEEGLMDALIGDDQLLRTLGHLIAIEMEALGYQRTGRKVEVPWNDSVSSDFEVFQLRIEIPE